MAEVQVRLLVRKQVFGNEFWLLRLFTNIKKRKIFRGEKNVTRIVSHVVHLLNWPSGFTKQTDYLLTA